MDAIDGIKPCVEEIIKDDPMLVSEHRKVYRPWGWYDSLEKDIGHQVKGFMSILHKNYQFKDINIGQKGGLLLKEWLQLPLDDKDYEYNVGDVVQINIMQIHSLANNTQNDLEIIEVQLGDYLGEDDIERFEDIYGRT